MIVIDKDQWWMMPRVSLWMMMNHVDSWWMIDDGKTIYEDYWWWMIANDDEKCGMDNGEPRRKFSIWVMMIEDT